MRFHFYLISHLQMLILIYQVFHMNNLQYLNIPLWHSQSNVHGFHTQSSLQKLQWSKVLHSHQHPSLFHLCFELRTLSFNLDLQSHDLCWNKHLNSFILCIKLNKFTFYALSRTHTRAYGSLIVLQLPPHLLTLPVNG